MVLPSIMSAVPDLYFPNYTKFDANLKYNQLVLKFSLCLNKISSPCVCYNDLPLIQLPLEELICNYV
jgi:hypothetical protein